MSLKTTTSVVLLYLHHILADFYILSLAHLLANKAAHYTSIVLLRYLVKCKYYALLNFADCALVTSTNFAYFC